jgi:thymidylate synthase (FAD)
MEFIRPSVEIWEQGNTLEDMWKHIARCTRVCYQSASNIKQGETAEEFVKRVILRMDSSTGELNWDKLHGAMLEHGTVYLMVKLPDDEITPSESLYHYKNNKHSIYNVANRTAYVTTNFRVLVENEWLDDLKYLCEPTSWHEKRYTFRMVTSIGVTRELNRHKLLCVA